MANCSGLSDRVPLYSDDDGSAREPESFGVDFLATGVTPDIRRGGGRGWGIRFGYLLGALNLLCLAGFAFLSSKSPPGATPEWTGGAVAVLTTLFALSAAQLVLKALKVPVLQSGVWQVVITIALGLYVMALGVGIR